MISFGEKEASNKVTSGGERKEIISVMNRYGLDLI